MRVLISGSSGFIGTNLVKRLSENPSVAIRAIDIVPPRCASNSVYHEHCDFSNTNQLIATVKRFQPDLFIHLGARTDLNGASLRDYRANIDGVNSVIAACAAVSSVKRVVFASTRLVCRIGYEPESPTDYCPNTFYGESKVLGEEAVRGLKGIAYDWSLIRPTSIWGPWFGVPYRNFFDAVHRGRYLHPRGHQIRKSFGFVGNSVSQIIELAGARASLFSNKMYYVCDYDPLDVLSFGRLIAQNFNVKDPATIPVVMLRAAAKVGDSAQFFGVKEPPLTSFRLKNLLQPMVHERFLLGEVLPVLPYSLEEGVRETVQWIRGYSG